MGLRIYNPLFFRAFKSGTPRAIGLGVKASTLLLVIQFSVVSLSGQYASASGEGTLAAQQTSADLSAHKVLTLEQALSLAEQNSPLLSEASASVNRARAGVQSARAYKNPEAQFMAGDQSARPITTPGVPGSLWHYSASQTLEIPRERKLRQQTSRLGQSAIEHRADGIKLSVMADVKRAFFDVIRRKEQLAHTQSNLELVEDLCKKVRIEITVGEKGKLELTRAEAELARAQASVRSAGIELAHARAKLKSVIGIDTEESIDADGTLTNTVTLSPLGELRPQVLASHPALAEANAQIDRSRTAVEHEKSLRIPQPTVSGEYERQPDISYYRFGVNIPLPTWDKRKGPIAEAQAEVARAEAMSRQRKLEIVAALERAYDQFQISNQQVLGLEKGSLREATAAVEAARAAYKYGERGIVEVLDAQRVLQGVRSDLLEASFSRQSALIDLEELGVTSK